jgi:L-2-hydroxyglutarate oxidase LhgO
MADVDTIIVGAGAVGLGVARALSVRGQGVYVLERNEGFGEETSARNSEVIHAGMYYPPGSIKAEACVRGAAMIYDYCGARGIRADRMGKLIVASDEAGVARLEELLERGRTNGVEDMEMMSPHAFRGIEPELHGVAAIWSPNSGIFDSHAYMLSLLGEVEEAGGALVRRSPFHSAARKNGEWHVLAGDGDPVIVTATNLIISAGLWASEAAKRVEGLEAHHIPKMSYARGNYFHYSGQQPFRHLIYPMPSAGGHGIHLTPDFAGQARLGPDVEEVDTIDYRVNAARKDVFADAIAKWWPSVDREKLTPDYAGIRPKIDDALKSFEDFRLVGEDQHGLSGLVCLFGIDSPGLTSSMALGERVADMLS